MCYWSMCLCAPRPQRCCFAVLLDVDGCCFFCVCCFRFWHFRYIYMYINAPYINNIVVIVGHKREKHIFETWWTHTRLHARTFYRPNLLAGRFTHSALFGSKYFSFFFIFDRKKNFALFEYNNHDEAVVWWLLNSEIRIKIVLCFSS